ncbi:MAG: hypothetical protein U0930_20615 [Pirellulales bacterium]
MMEKKGSQPQERVRRGELVEVRSAEEILTTLDSGGTNGHLPFMPEMLKMLGKQFRVYRRVEHFSFDGDETCGDESSVRAFPENDVVVLENCRCSGQSHGNCKRGCSIFWREAWLKPVQIDVPKQKGYKLTEQSKSKANHTAVSGSPDARSELENRLITNNTEEPEQFYCQSSQLLIATQPVSFAERLKRCIRNVATGNYGLIEMLRNIAVWFSVRGREKLFGPFPVGSLKQTPVELLNLQAGELVQVKSLQEIKQTLDHRGFNRGLHFAPEMIPYCGKILRVTVRADKMIAEGIGVMRTMKNTVILEGCVCDSATWAFGACPRQDFIYWREIWLKRVEPKVETNFEASSVEPIEPAAAK